MQYRGLTQSEYPRLLDLLEEVNIAPREYFRNLYDLDPYEDPELSRVAVDGGRFVGHVRVFPRPHGGGAAQLWSGAIANVGTLADYRGRGVCRQLLEDSVALMRKRGMHYSTVLSGVPVYGKCGWEELPRTGHLVSVHDVRLPMPHDWSVRIFVRERDLVQVAAIYEEFNRERPLAVQRSMDYWFANLNTAIETSSLFLVVEQNGEVAAYMRGHQKGDAVTCLEAAHRCGAEQAYAALAWVFSRYYRKCSWRTVRLRLPGDHPLIASLSAVFRVDQVTVPHLWMRLVDLAGLLESFAPLWSRRIATARVPGSSCCRLQCADQEAVLRLGATSSVEASTRSQTVSSGLPTIALSQRELFELIFGVSSDAVRRVLTGPRERRLWEAALRGPAAVYWGADDV